MPTAIPMATTPPSPTRPRKRLAASIASNQKPGRLAGLFCFEWIRLCDGAIRAFARPRVFRPRVGGIASRESVTNLTRVTS